MTTRKRTLSIALTLLMLISTTLASAAVVNDFSNGLAEVTVELRDQGVWTSDTDAGIDLPAGETVNAAGVIVGTAVVEHAEYTTIDHGLLEEIWNPQYNVGLTTYSSLNDFTYEEKYLELTSLGYNADFEKNSRNWQPGPDVGMNNWGHMVIENGYPIHSNCAIGEWCWGTNFMDPDYSDDSFDSSFAYILTSEPMYVTTGKAEMTVQSYHGLYYRNYGTTTQVYDDCAYIAVMNSTNGQDWNNAVYVPFNIQQSTGISPGNGFYQVAPATAGINPAAKVPIGQCNGVSSQSITGPAADDYVLAGRSELQSNPSGWASLSLNLASHAGRYIRLVFVMESNDKPAAPANISMPGWYIDGVRVGDPLPQQGHVIMSSFAPIQNPNPGFPDGYGVLHIDLKKSESIAFGVDILAAGSQTLVFDRDGAPMSNLQGSTIELWNIDGDAYPLIDLKFTYSSGAQRLSTPSIHGFSLGTRIGTTFNGTDGVFAMGGMFGDGKWTSPPVGDSFVFYSPSMLDTSFTPDLWRSRFSLPISSIKPMVSDSCGGPASINILSLNDNDTFNSAQNGQWLDFNEPTFNVAVQVNYTTMCDVYSITVDLKFAHHARGVTLDFAADGDIEWGMTDPAFGRFGFQNMFRTGLTNGVNTGSSSRAISVNTQGVGEGATFMIPKDATIRYAEVSYEQNTLGEFDLKLIAGSQEESLGLMSDLTRYTPEVGWDLTSIQSTLQSLMDNPLVPTSFVDNYGNEWVTYRFGIDAPSAPNGASVNFRDLKVVYDWSRAISDGNNVARELNQGVALAGGNGTVTVPVRVSAQSGGAVHLSSLSVSTTSGYDTTMETTDLSGLYPNGEIIELITTHYIAASTGQTIGAASLLFESSAGNIELRWTESNDTFWELMDPDDHITLLQSIAVDDAGGKRINWRFRVNPEWDDTESVRIYASVISNTGVNGLPDGILLDPATGNAVENDAGIISFKLFNQAMIEQTDLDNAASSNVITLVFDVKLEDLSIAPDPSAYSVTLEKRNQSNVTEEWLHVDSTPGEIDGNFTWSPGIPVNEAGAEYYRVRVDDYSSGDTVCPPAEFNPDSECSIRFSLSLDPFAPQLVNISVFSAQGDWRPLTDDTWVPVSTNQKFRIVAQDLPVAPEFLTLNYWVEAEHDLNDNREAELLEYASTTLLRNTVTDTSEYYIDSPCMCINDFANSGIDPPQMVSLFVSGTDVGGNQINGRGPGINSDLVTYIGMDSRTPGISAFHISDTHGTMLTEFNKSVYAGNEYHLLVDAKDDNGWRDVNWIRITLNPQIGDDEGSIELYYSPRNDTAWTDTDYIEIIDDYNNTGLKPRVTRRDGGVLISPFEQLFTLDLPVRLSWTIPPAYVSGVMSPDIAIRDMDENNPLSKLGGQSYRQRWQYSSGIQLDTTIFSVEDTVGFITQGVGTQEGGFVYQGDMLRLTGRYAFSDGFNDGIFVPPEIPLTMEITRAEVTADGIRGYQYAPNFVETFDFDNGTFEIFMPAPIQTNEFTFTIQLLGLPTGAIDLTSTPARTFYVKVDGDAPEAVFNSWGLRNHNTGESFTDGQLSSSQIGCLDAETFINEKQALDIESIRLNWMFFKSDVVGGFAYNWTGYLNAFNEPWQSVQMNVDTSSVPQKAVAICVNLWDADSSIPSDLGGVVVKFWVSGHDTAGNGLENAGAFGASIPGGEYGLRYEAADYNIRDIALSTASPMARTNFDLMLNIENVGNKNGTMVVQLVTKQGDIYSSPVMWSCPEDLEPGERYLWRIRIDQFDTPQTGVEILVLNPDGEELTRTGVFHVAKYEEASSGLSLFAIFGVVGILLLLVIAVIVVLVVVNRGVSTEEEDEYIDDVDFLPPGQAVEPLQTRGPPATRPGERRGPPATRASDTTPSVDPKMAAALEKFPFWDEATIQGYFDQGWSLDQLEDWLANQ